MPGDGIEDDTPEGEELRREAGVYLETHGRAEFDIPGITFGTRYDGSPILWNDGSAPPPDAAGPTCRARRPVDVPLTFGSRKIARCSMPLGSSGRC